jgi:integrase
MASIRQDSKSKKWLVDFKKGFRRKRLYFNSRRDAEDFRRDLLLRDNGFVSDDIKPLPLEEAVSRYSTTISSVKAPRTQRFEGIVFREFLKYFGKAQLHEITLTEIQGYQAFLRKVRLGQSVNRQFNTLKHFFKTCMDWKCIGEDPCTALKRLPETQQKAKRVLRLEELSKIFQIAQPWLRDILWFSLISGARRSQSCAIRWSSIDLKGKYIHLEASEGFDPKDREANTLPMSLDMIEFFTDLYEHARRRFKAKYDDHVFLDQEGNPILPDRLTHEAHKLLKSQLGLEHGAVHIFRRTSVTLRHQLGVSLDDVRKISGHSNVKTTMLYVASEPEHLRAQMDKTPLVKPFWLGKKTGDSMAANGSKSKTELSELFDEPCKCVDLFS